MPGTLFFYLNTFLQYFIMPKEKAMMPQSTAGLIRYFDQSQESIKLQPIHVVIISMALIAMEVVLKFMFFI